MKSRLLSMAAALFLLLGLVSTSAFAQISSSANVNFFIKSYQADGDMAATWHDWETTADTVGRKIDVAGQWVATSQSLPSVTYTLTLPAGTVLESTVADSTYMYIYDSQWSGPRSFPNTGEPQVVKVAAADIVIDGNPIASYEADKRPSISVTSNIQRSQVTTYQIRLLKGVYIGKMVEEINSSDDGFMVHSFQSSGMAGTSYDIEDSLKAINDLPEGVVFNTGIGAYIDGEVFSVNDTIVFVDIFGNPVPYAAYPGASASNAMQLIVPAADGDWDTTGVTEATDNGDAGDHLSLNATKDTLTVVFSAAGGDMLAGDEDDTDGFLYNGTSYSRVVLGGVGSTRGGMGLAFDGTTDSDSTHFYVKLTVGDPALALAHKTVLGMVPDSLSMITRAMLGDDAAEQIGSLDISAVTIGGPTYVGGRLQATFTVTLGDIFGDAFTGTTIGTDTDPVGYKFKYYAWDADEEEMVYDATKTGYLQNATQVTSKFTRPAATFNNTNMATDVFSASQLVGDLAASAITISAGNTNLPVYFGMDSHPADDAAAGEGDSICVILYAVNDESIMDSFFIKVQPGSPVKFDTDSLQAYLADEDVNPVKGLPINADLPIFALDTSYNRVSNLLLSAGNSFLDGISINGTGSIKAMNLLIDGRDPAGYDFTESEDLDSLDLDFNTIARTITGISLKVEYDSAWIGNITDHAVESEDSSRFNLGGDGDDPLSLRLNYLGTNRRLYLSWDPAAMGSGYNAASRVQDLALFNLLSPSLVDSLQNLRVTLPVNKAGRTDTLNIKVTLPVSMDGTPNVLDQNSADSLFYMKLVNFGETAGLPAGLEVTGIMVSADSSDWYDALSVYQGSGAGQDSVAFKTPIVFDATSVDEDDIYIKVYGVVLPTRANVADSFKVMLASSATAIYATTAVTIGADTLAQYVLVPPSGDQDTVLAGVKYKDYIDLGDGVDTLTVGDTTYFQVVMADQYGNVITGTKGANFANKLIFTSVDSTSTGNSMEVLQWVDGAVSTNGSGDNMVDSIVVKIDSVSGGSSTSGYFADSVGIVPASTNMGMDYAITVSDTTGKVIVGSAMVYVRGGAVASLTLDPDSNMISGRDAALPMLSVTAKDAYGNNVGAASITIARAYGADGAFTDTNGVAVTTTLDTVTIKTALSGTATAVFETGAVVDSVALKVSATGATTKYFTASLQTPIEDMIFSVTSPADSLEPSVAVAGTIVAEVTDGNDVAEVWVNVWSSKLTRNAENTWDESEPVYIEKAASTTGSSDVVEVSLAIGDTADVDTASVIRYQLVGVDADDDTTWSDTMMYVVSPNRGKRNMTADNVNVADVMRLVYLIAIDEIVPSDVDYLGLDLDVDGTFDTPDLLAELAIWKGTGTLLAGVSVPENATAKAELTYEATDKKIANLALNLDASDNLNVAVFRIKYDTEKFTFGEAKATERLQGVSVVSDANETEGIYTIVVINTEGGQIVKGSGALLNIQISAVGEKFDGVGEISLLNASFDEGVSAEISREVLSPKALLPKAFAMSQNYPNPFNPSTTIAYDIPEGDNVQVQLKVYNMRGQLVRTLVEETKSEGSYQIQWDGSDNYGRRVSSGVYFYRIKAGEFSKTRKMVILK